MQKLKFGELSPDFEVVDRPELVVLCELRSIDTINIRVKKTPLGETITLVPNDIQLYIDQQKIAAQNPAVISSIVTNFVRMSAQLSDAFKGLSDEQICDTVKSRYIQSTTDMHSYVQGLQSTIIEMSNEYKQQKLTAAKAAKAAKQTADTPPSTE